ncbi:hypothetical protein IC229_20370 [Spirosoma sp. BT702]|uniref:DUF3108 domain-containing protein n=1 Tax=Spirosoma profusum TaxID=2771354 RepID=A0A926XY53_9BACT|nr:hypothetical protein [Spirosoma profusum]MBD2703013.1 hypothetical protein [Spirosoma profusum]
MRTLFVALLLTVAVLRNGLAQDCLGFTFKKGASFEMSTFSAKDKPTGKIQYEVKDVKKEGPSTIIDMMAVFQDDKGNQRPPFNIRYTCTGNELIADMSGMMQAMQTTAMKDAEMKMKANKLVYPGKFSVGQKLSDGQMEVEMVSSGSTMMTMNMVMTNRQVEGQESLTTPAGTFSTYKITSDTSFESRVMGIPIRNSMKTVSYRAENQILDVKAETYNKNGKLMGYTLLTKAQ